MLHAAPNTVALPIEAGRVWRWPIATPFGAIAIALALAGVVLAYVLERGGLTLHAPDFLRFAALAAAMLVLAGWCRMRALDRRLSDAALLVSAATVSLMVCGIISNAGLRLGAPLIDTQLVAIDAAFGIHVERSVRAMADHPWLIAGLAALYNASGIAVVGLLSWAVIAGARARAWELAVTCFVSMQVVAVVSIAFPAIGAMAHLGLHDMQGAGLPRGAGVYHLAAFEHFRSGSDSVVRLADLNGLVTFPSFHTVLALLATQTLWDTRLRWPAVAWTALVVVSTIPIGGHYVTDLVAGFTVWCGAAWLARRVSSPSA